MTLVELTVSLVLVTVIMAASGSLVFVAAKALSGEASNVGSDAAAARAAADQVVDDLKVATAVTEQTATAITMTVPDRDADGDAETVRYAWTGVPGDPLTRSYNGGAAGVVAANVRALNFTYLAKTVGRPPPVEGAEQSIAAHASATSANWVGYQLTDLKGAGGRIAAPALPAAAVSWQPTRCRLMLQRNGASTGTATVAVFKADAAGKPTGASLASGSVLIVGVLTSGAAWVDVPLTSAAAVPAGQAVCLTVTYVKLVGAVGGYAFADAASTDANTSLLTTGDTGATWTGVAGSSLQFGLWGKVTTQESETLDFQPLPQAAP